MLLERDRLTSGTTWHAAGLMVTFGSTSETSTEMRQVHPRPLRAARGRDRPVHRLQAGRLHRGRRRRRTGSRSTAACRRSTGYCGVDVHEISPARGRRAVPARPHRRHARRLLRHRGRPRQPGRRHDGAGQGRAPAGRDDRSRACRSPACSTDARRRDRRAHRRTATSRRVRRQLRRHVGAPARRGGRREHPAAGGRALLPDHREDRRASTGRGRCSRTRRPTATSARRAAG